MATKWKAPEYSRSVIARAGATLIDSDATIFEKTDAIEKMENWRTAHAYPMHAVLMLLRNKARKIDQNSTIAQRLKRSASIVIKLERFDTMKLSRMQDIAGCRAVLNNQRSADRLRSDLLRSGTRHKIHSEKNYVDTPKESGYRGYHMIVKYRGSKKEYEGLSVEIQIRTRSQHAWATAVEVVGTFIGKSLKTGEGHEKWDEFFALAGHVLSGIETPGKNSSDEESADIERFRELVLELNVKGLLGTISATADYLDQLSKSEAKNSYYLLMLDTRSGPESALVKVTTYAQADFEDATKEYGKLEKQYRSEKKIDVVLVAVDSINSLREAYPNYFADSNEFLKLISLAIGEPVSISEA